MSDHGIKILIDSGAFSTWTKGEKIDIRRYAKFLHKYKDRLFGYFNLDVIPGVVGNIGDADQVENSARKSFENYLWLEKEGLQPIPVYHEGERMYWLEKILDTGTPYIAISPLKLGTGKSAQKWLDIVWSKLVNAEGLPVVKTHCLGLTSYDVITRYPWFSFDSTSWKMEPAYGAILIPQYEDGRWNFALRPERVILSGERNLTFGLHFRELENLSDAIYNRVRYYVEDIVETTFSELRYLAPVRSRTAVYVNERLCDVIAKKPIRIAASAGLKLFGGHSLRKSVEIRRPLFVYAAASSANYFRNLIKGTGSCALYSFAEMQHGLNDFMEAVLSGELPSGRDEFKPNWKSEAYLNARRMNLIDRIRSNEDA